MYIHSSIFPTGQCLCHVEFVMGIDFSVCVCLLSLKHSMCLIKCLLDFVGSKFAELFDWLQLMSSELTLLFADRHFVCKNSSIYGCLFCLC